MEFQVNKEIESYQSNTSVVKLSNGSFVVTWASNDKSGSNISDNDAYHIAAQIFNANGDAIGNEFQVNTQIDSSQNNPSVSAVGDGFVITWDSEDTTGSGNDDFDSHVAAQIFTSSGSKIGSEFQVNTETSRDQKNPSVTELNDGTFIITWESADRFGDGLTDDKDTHISAQIFSASGSKVSSEFQVNTEVDSYQRAPSVSVLNDNGDFVIVWQSQDISGSDNSGYHISAQMYSANGNKTGSEFQVNTEIDTFQINPSVATLSDGSFVVVWQSHDSSGSGITDTDSYHIAAQRYAANGDKIGSEIQINSETESFQSEPTVIGTSSGGFVVTWQSNDTSGSKITDNDASHIAAKIFNSNGAAVGSEFQVNSETDSGQYSPDIEALDNGDFLITWQSNDSNGTGITDDSSSHIAAQMFDSDGDKIDEGSSPDTEPDPDPDPDDPDSKDGGDTDPDPEPDPDTDSTLVRRDSNDNETFTDAGYFIALKSDGDLYGTDPIDYAVYDNYDLGDLTIEENSSSSLDEFIFDITSGSTGTSSKNYTESLHDVERLEFDDTHVALDLNIDQSSGAALALLYSVFNEVPDAQTAGKWISEADEYFLDDNILDQSEYIELSQDMIDHYAPNGVDNESFVNLLYTNVVADSDAYDDSLKDSLLNSLENGNLTQASLFSIAAQTDENQSHYSEFISQGLQYEKDASIPNTVPDIEPDTEPANGTLDTSDISEYTSIVIHKNITLDEAVEEYQEYEEANTQFEYYFALNSDIVNDGFNMENLFLQDHDTVWNTYVYSEDDIEYGDYSVIIGVIDTDESIA